MYRNKVRSTVVNTSATLKDQEGYAVGMDGQKTAAAGDFVFGIVTMGRPANEASEVQTGGEVEAIVNGGSTAIAAEDPLTGGASGKLIKGTLGTHKIRAYAKAAATTDGATITVLMT